MAAKDLHGIPLANFVEDHLRIISVKFHQIWPIGFKEVVLVIVDGRTPDKIV